MSNLTEEELISAIHQYIIDNYYSQYDGADIFGDEITYHFNNNRALNISINMDFYDDDIEEI